VKQLIDRDERDVEDMRQDNAIIILEPHGAKKGRRVRDWAHMPKIIDPGASHKPNDGIFGDNQQS
jgi:hypothetical protein